MTEIITERNQSHLRFASFHGIKGVMPCLFHGPSAGQNPMISQENNLKRDMHKWWLFNKYINDQFRRMEELTPESWVSLKDQPLNQIGATHVPLGRFSVGLFS